LVTSHIGLAGARAGEYEPVWIRFTATRVEAPADMRIMIFFTYFNFSDAGQNPSHLRSDGQKHVKIEPFDMIFSDSCLPAEAL
jgi:hypothetical protein